MRRGDRVTVAMPGDFGKPRPALVIQADQFSATASLTVALITTSLVDAPLMRLTLDPTPENGLRKISQVMIDKVMTVRREKLGLPFGQLDNNTMLTINRGLALFLGIA